MLISQDLQKYLEENILPQNTTPPAADAAAAKGPVRGSLRVPCMKRPLRLCPASISFRFLTE